VEDHRHPTSEVLGLAECLELLRSCSVGRLAVAEGDGAPLVVPVNFVLDDDVIVFRTDVGAKLDALRRHPASFQVDSIDPVHHTGWSVLVRGVAYESSPAAVEREPWDGGPKRHWVRLFPGSVTGRRFVFEVDDLDGRGYR
jgi:nitroimidazol reductase NimA-like FMN-containing flavoprotein (pyridoxamine 5'-phosphate oxidase superfamily)